jgi:tetratricopeptide (TPR) repeat protein
MSDPTRALLSYLRRPDDRDARASLESACPSDLAAARNLARDEPASAAAAAVLLGRMILEGADDEALVDAAKAAAQRAPREAAGDDVTLVAAEIVWRRSGQPVLAEPYYRRVRRNDPARAEVLEFYRELFAGDKDAAQLMQVLVQARRASRDPAVRFALAEEMAALAQGRLGSADRAIESWRSVLREDGHDPRAVAHLQRLYRETGKWTALVELLKEELDAIEAAPTNTALRIEKLLEIARLYRDELRLDAMTLATLQRILEIDPGHEESLSALADTYVSTGRFNDLLGVYQRLIQAAAEAGDQARRIDLLLRVAGIWVHELGNPQRALEPLGEILAASPGHAAARQLLAQIHEQRRDWRALIALRREELAEREGEQALPLRLELARLSEQRLGDRTEAIADWNAVLEHHGDNDEALDALQRLYARENRWAEAAEIMHRSIEACSRPADAVRLLIDLGRLYAERLRDVPASIAVWREVARIVPGHERAVRKLRDAYVAAQAWDELTDLFEGQGNLAAVVDVLNSAADRLPAVDDRVALYLRVANLCKDRLGQPERALRALERTLAIQPENLDVARELLPIYREQGNWARLMSTYEVLLAAAPSRTEQLELIGRLRDIAVEKIGSSALAFQWSARAYELAPEEPGRREQLEAVAEQCDAWDELTRIFEARIGGEGITVDEQLSLLGKLAVIARDRLFKPDDAQRYFRRVIDIDPNSAEAMAALEQIYTATRRYDDLSDVYRRRLDVTDDPDARLATLRGLARLQSEHLKDFEAAAATYRRVLELVAADREALDALASIHRNRGEWEPLARVLQTKIDLTPEAHDQVPLWFELAQIRAGRLGETAGAVQGFLRILELAPRHTGAVAALEQLRRDEPGAALVIMRGLLPYYRRVEDRVREAAAMEVILEAETDPAARRQQLTHLAGLYGKMPDRKLDALRMIAELFQGQPGDWDTRSSFARLAAELSRVDELAARYEAVLADLRAAASRAQEEGRPVDRTEAALRRDLLVELGATYRDALRRSADAERIFAEVLEQDETHQGAYEAMEALLSARGAHAELMALYRRRVDVIFNQREQKDLLGRIVHLARGVLGDRTTAIRTAEELLDLIPDDVPTIQLLAGMYQEGDTQADREKLEELLGRWAGFVADRNHRFAIQCKRAQLRMQFLGDAFGAVDLLGGVLGEEPSHGPARQLLEELLDISEVQLQVAALLDPIYVGVGDHRGRIRVLHVRRAQAAASGAIDEATSHLLEIARIEEHELHDLATAFEAARDAYLMDPRRHDTLGEVERLGRRLGKDRELVEVWTRALHSPWAADKTLRIDLVGRIAQTLDERLRDAPGARTAYMELLALDPPDFELAHRTVAALCRLHLEAGDFLALVEAQRSLLRFTDALPEQVRIRLDIARYQLEYLLDRVGAALTWSEVLDMDPANGLALDALEQLFSEEEEWARLTEVLAHRIGVSADPRVQAALHRTIGDLRRHRIGDRQGAIESFQSVLDLKIGRDESNYALSNLVEINRDLERWPDVEDGLRRLTALATRDQDRVELLTATAEVIGRQAGRGQDALDLLKRVLDLSPTHARARSMVGGYLDPDETHERAVRILMPLYEAEQNWGALLELQELQARKQPSGRRRLGALLRVAATQEERLQDSERAFNTLCAAFVEAKDQPELAEILEKVERLGARPERAEALFSAYAQTVDHILDSDLQRRVLRSMGEVALDRLGRLDDARAAYERILALRPEDGAAADALEQIYGRQGDAAALAELLGRRAEHEPDGRRRDDFLVRAAEITRRQLDRAGEAVGLYERLSVEGMGRPEVVEVLETLYAQAGRWEALARLLGRKLEHISGKPLVEAHLRLGRLWGERLQNPEEGIRHLSAALRLDPEHAVGNDELGRYLDDQLMRARVADVLEPVFAAVHDWPRLVQIQEIKLEQAADEDTRVRILLRIAQIHEEQLEDLEQAFNGFARVFREQPFNRYVRDQLARLANVLERGAAFAELLETWLRDDAAGDEREEVLQIVREAADLWARGLKVYDRAVPLYRRLLDARPDAHDVFAAMEQALIAGGMWAALLEAYWREVDGTLDEGRQVDLLIKLSTVALNAENRPDDAVRALGRVLELRPEHAQARLSLERVLEQEGRHRELLDLLRDRIARTQTAAERIALHVRAAGLQDARLDDPEGAVDTIEALLAESPTAPEAVTVLEQLAESRAALRGRIFDLLQPIYEATGNVARQVAVVEWRLSVNEDPARRHELFAGLARLLETMPGGADYAFRALCRAVAEPGPADALRELDAELARLAGQLAIPAALAQALVSAAASPALASDVDRRVQLHVRAGRLQLEVGDPARAAEVLRAALELRADDDEALGLLDHALVRLGHHEDLRRVLERRIDVCPEDTERVELARRLATLLEDVLVQSEAAQRAWRAVLELEPQDREALQRLSKSYAASGSTADLVEVLVRRIEATTEPAARRDLRMQLASLQREANRDREAEIEVLRELLSEAPTDDDAMAALGRALVACERWAEASEVCHERALGAATDERRAQHLLEAARLHAGPLDDRPGAIERYERILALAPGHEGAIADLVALTERADVSEAAAALVRPALESLGRSADLATVLAARARTSEDPAERATLLRELAAVRYERLSDPAGAYEATMALLERCPSDELPIVLQGALRLSVELGQVGGCVDALARWSADDGREPEARVALGLGAAWAASEALHDGARALAVLRGLMDADIADLQVCDGIEHLAGAAGDAALAARALEEGARASAGQADQPDRLVRLGYARLGLGNAAGALEAFRDALDVKLGHPGAIGGLEKLLEVAGDPPAGLLDVLEAAYHSIGDRQGVARVLRSRLGRAGGPERLQLLQNLAQTCEEGALWTEAIAAWGRLLALDGENQHAIERLVALAGQQGVIDRAGELMLEAIDAARGEGRSCVPVSLACARVQLDLLGNPQAAIRAVAGVLDEQPEHPEGLEMLVTARRAAREPRGLHDALVRAAQAQGVPDRAAALWREAAAVAESAIADPALAASDLEQVIDNDETDADAWRRLLALRAAAERWDALAEGLARRAVITADEAERRDLRYRLANLLVQRLDRVDDAASVYVEMIAAAPDDLTAIRELEVLYRRLGRWSDLRELLDRKLEAVSGADRIRVFEEIARLAETQLDDTTDAVEVLGRLLAEDADHEEGLASLERLLTRAERWIDLAELLERRMNQRRDQADMDGFREAASQLAELLAGRLDDTDRAQHILTGLLEVDPVYVPAIISLASVYEARGDEGAMRLTLKRAADLDPQGPVGAQLQLRMARLSDDPAESRQYLERALQLDPGNAEATRRLLELAREQEQWDQVAYLLELAAGRVDDPERRRELTLERVDVLSRRLGDFEGALRVLAGLYERVQDDPEVNQRIADSLFQAGRVEEAAGMYSWLVEVTGKGKRGKEPAHNLTRLARIELAAGHADEAQKHLDEAYRMDTTNVETLLTLGTLHEQRQRWADALKIYRAMLLQNAEQSGLLRRGDIYLRLSAAHLGLDERPKAQAMLRRGIEEDPSHPQLQATLASLEN